MALRGDYADDVLTSIGWEVYLKTGSATGNGTLISGAYNFGDLGGDAAELDATPLASTHSIKKAGLVDLPAWELDYYLNDDDFDAIEGMKGSTVTVTVLRPDGVKYVATGEVGSNYPVGQGVNGVAAAKAKIMLASEFQKVTQ